MFVKKRMAETKTETYLVDEGGQRKKLDQAPPCKMLCAQSLGAADPVPQRWMPENGAGTPDVNLKVVRRRRENAQEHVTGCVQARARYVEAQRGGVRQMGACAFSDQLRLPAGHQR